MAPVQIAGRSFFHISSPGRRGLQVFRSRGVEAWPGGPAPKAFIHIEHRPGRQLGGDTPGSFFLFSAKKAHVLPGSSTSPIGAGPPPWLSAVGPIAAVGFEHGLPRQLMRRARHRVSRIRLIHLTLPAENGRQNHAGDPLAVEARVEW